MITFKQFVNEHRTSSEDDQSFHRVELTLEDAFKRIETHCSDYLELVSSVKKLRIYRGDNNTTGCIATFGDSDSFVRYSANTHNWYNMWIDSSEKWKKYPPRLSSYICSNRQESSDSYGSLMAIFPYNDAKIGIASAADMWESFKNGFNEAGLKPGAPITDIALDDLMDITYNIQKILGIKISQTNAKSMRNTLKEIDLHDEKLSEEIEGRATILSGFIQSARAHYKTLYEVYDAIFDPVVNKFTATTPGSIPGTNKAGQSEFELWVGGKCVFININYLQLEAKEEDLRLVNEFFKKHNLPTIRKL